jgi:KUP system potassium uptake protein
VTVLNEDIPEVPAAQRLEVRELTPTVRRVTIRYGFHESPDIPRDMDKLKDIGVPWDPMRASYFLGREVLAQAAKPEMSKWRQWLYGLIARNAVPATEFFRIPADRVVELGVRVAI